MKRGKVRWLGGLMFGIFVFSVALATILPSAALAAALKVSVVTSMSGPGYGYGQRSAIGLRYRTEEINKAGGINGYPVEVIIYDTATKAAESAMLVERAARVDKVFAILGPNSSSDVAAAFPVANRIGIPDVSLAGTIRGLCEKNAPWAFATMMSDDYSMEPLVSLIDQYKVKKMVIMVDAKYNYAVSQGEWAYKIAKRKGVKVLHKKGQLDVETGWADFTPRVTQIKALNPDLICAILFPQDLAHFGVALESAGISAKKIPCFGSLMVLPDMIVAGGKAVEGWYGSADFLVGGGGDEVQQKWEEKLSAYAKTQTKDPGISTVQTNTACGYDAAAFVYEAMKRANITPHTPLAEGRIKIRDELPKIRMKTYSSKEFYFGKGGRYEKNRLVKPVYLLRIENGKLVGAGTIYYE